MHQQDEIFFGSNARRLAASLSDLKHGTLTGAESTQSVFVFQIGRYIFSEWSHSGKLRVHALRVKASLFDDEEKINRSALISNAKAE